jgi:hypothetical protein
MKASSVLNNKGIALLSVMGIAAIMAIMMFSMTLMATNIKKMNKGNLVKAQVSGLKNNLLRIVHDQVLCGLLFGGVVFDHNNTSAQGVSTLPPSGGTTPEMIGFTSSYGRLQLNAKIGNDLKVTSMSLQSTYTAGARGLSIATPFLLPGPGLRSALSTDPLNPSVYQDASGTLIPISVSLMIQLQNLAVFSTGSSPSVASVAQAFGPPYYNILIPNIYLNLRNATSPPIIESCVPPRMGSGFNQNVTARNAVYNQGWTAMSNSAECQPLQTNSGNSNGINCAPGFYVVSLTPNDITDISKVTIFSYQCCKVTP